MAEEREALLSMRGVFLSSERPYERKMTYDPLLIGFLHKLFSMQDLRHNVFHLPCSSTAAITASSCASESSPTNDKGAALKRQFPFVIDLNKILPDYSS